MSRAVNKTTARWCLASLRCRRAKLRQAYLINPHGINSLKDSPAGSHERLSAQRRARRMRVMRRQVFENDIDKWASTFLDDLEELNRARTTNQVAGLGLPLRSPGRGRIRPEGSAGWASVVAGSSPLWFVSLGTPLAILTTEQRVAFRAALYGPRYVQVGLNVVRSSRGHRGWDPCRQCRSPRVWSRLRHRGHQCDRTVVAAPQGRTARSDQRKLDDVPCTWLRPHSSYSRPTSHTTRSLP